MSPMAAGQCQGVGVPHGHRALPCPQSIETLRVDGSGRHSFPAVLRSHTEPLGLAVFESRFFWTDGTELVSATQASPQEHAVLLRAPVSAFTVLHELQQPPREYPAGRPHQCRAGSTPTASLDARGGCTGSWSSPGPARWLSWSCGEGLWACDRGDIRTRRKAAESHGFG